MAVGAHTRWALLDLARREKRWQKLEPLPDRVSVEFEPEPPQPRSDVLREGWWLSLSKVEVRVMTAVRDGAHGLNGIARAAAVRRHRIPTILQGILAAAQEVLPVLHSDGRF
jgi:hypothetical protein